MLTKKQLAARRTGIGGSDAPIITGYSHFENATNVHLYLQKIGAIPHDDIENKYTYWGSKLESVVRDEFQKETGLSVELRLDTIRHPDHDFILGHIDGYIPSEKAVLECKTTSSYHLEWGQPGTDEMPKNYLIQCVHYAMLTGVTKVYLAVFMLHKLEFNIYCYNRNVKLENILMGLEKEFWLEHVKKEIPPPVRTLKDASLLWPKANKETEIVVATPEQVEAIEKISELKKKQKELEKEEEQYQLKVLENLKCASKIIGPDGKPLATWNNVEVNRLNQDRLKKEQPDLYKEYLMESSYRQFRVSVNRGKKDE